MISTWTSKFWGNRVLAVRVQALLWKGSLSAVSLARNTRYSSSEISVSVEPVLNCGIVGLMKNKLDVTCKSVYSYCRVSWDVTTILLITDENWHKILLEVFKKSKVHSYGWWRPTSGFSLDFLPQIWFWYQILIKLIVTSSLIQPMKLLLRKKRKSSPRAFFRKPSYTRERKMKIDNW